MNTVWQTRRLARVCIPGGGTWPTLSCVNKPPLEVSLSKEELEKRTVEWDVSVHACLNTQCAHRLSSVQSVLLRFLKQQTVPEAERATTEPEKLAGQKWKRERRILVLLFFFLGRHGAGYFLYGIDCCLSFISPHHKAAVTGQECPAVIQLPGKKRDLKAREGKWWLQLR